MQRFDDLNLTASYRFGDISYAKEELRAELASVFLAAESGIPHNPEQHAAYVGLWIKTLKEDKNEIFRAAQDASRAADFLLALERDRSIAGEMLAAGSLLYPAPLGRLSNVVLEREYGEPRTLSGGPGQESSTTSCGLRRKGDRPRGSGAH